jgi:hypothetical protein
MSMKGVVQALPGDPALDMPAFALWISGKTFDVATLPLHSALTARLSFEFEFEFEYHLQPSIYIIKFVTITTNT